MTFFTRAGLAVLGLTMVAPVAVRAQSPATPTNAHNHSRGLFGKQKLCAECQRAKLQAQGINIPPPPALPNEVVTEGGVCTSCQAAAGQGQTVIIDGNASGYAVVGGDSAPGYAVVGGQGVTADPSPIGVVAARPGQVQPPMQGRAGTGDRSVMPVSAEAPEPIRPPGSNRPHILSHLFGFSAIGRDYREEMQRKSGEKHAAIRFDQQDQKITELPASKVYGSRWGR